MPEAATDTSLEENQSSSGESESINSSYGCCKKNRSAHWKPEILYPFQGHLLIAVNLLHMRKLSSAIFSNQSDIKRIQANSCTLPKALSDAHPQKLSEIDEMQNFVKILHRLPSPLHGFFSI